LALGLGLAQTALAATIVLDKSTGANYDAVGDGWFFAGPGAPPPDGVGDLGGNALAVAFKAGVLELRAMAEFPLAPLAGITAAQVQSATVTFKIDDVISTFGPGAGFDGTASDPIAVFHYPADGVVTVADFAPPGLAQLGVVTVGVVTDATLATTGPLTFTVDATAKLKDALTAGDAAFGVLFATLDTPTATSLDDLSPPGVPGGALPTLTVETVPTTPPVLSSAAQACQTAIANEGRNFVASALKAFAGCFGLVLKDAADSTLDPKTKTKCAGQLDPASANSKFGKALAKFTDKVVNGKCAGLKPADIGSPCDGSATTIGATAACILNGHRAAVDDIVRDQYASACTLLAAVGLDATFPGVCAP
jgi:hypothetical protein